MSASNRIQALPLHLANQIAAGEVIERPASVVKELVENSIDAGANEISIEIEGAGSQLIRIRDNGFGIHPEDLSLALSRHATSKLHTSEQLSHIASLGFRGEALPSIASISNLILSSRQHDSDCGWQYSANTDTVSPTSHPLGTSVEVRELFFNLPARRHFLRGNKTEQNHITTTLYRLALSQFKIGFQYQFSSSSTIKLPIAQTHEQQQQRIAKICGKAFIDNSLCIQQQYEEIELKGWIGTPEAHRPQTDINYFFINGRVIRDRVINHAIRQAYADLIPAGRYPAFVLYLTMPLDRVDINVHPTKHEVRFRDARLIHGLITRALQDALASISSSEKPVTSLPPEKQFTSNHHVAEKPSNYRSPKASNLNSERHNIGTIVSLLHQRYAIVQTNQQSLLIDLQQAERQLRQQQLQQAIATDTVSSRPILVPLKIALDEQLLTAMIEHQVLLSKLGINFQSIDNQLVIKSIPSLLAHVNVNELITAIASLLSINPATIEQFSELLQQQLPLVTIHTMQHAETIIKQLSMSEKLPIWCQELDQKTLSSLF